MLASRNEFKISHPNPSSQLQWQILFRTFRLIYLDEGHFIRICLYTLSLYGHNKKLTDVLIIMLLYRMLPNILSMKIGDFMLRMWFYNLEELLQGQWFSAY